MAALCIASGDLLFCSGDSNTRRGRGPDKPLITDELERLRKKPPRVGKTQPLDQLVRLASPIGWWRRSVPRRQAEVERREEGVDWEYLGLV